MNKFHKKISKILLLSMVIVTFLCISDVINIHIPDKNRELSYKQMIDTMPQDFKELISTENPTAYFSVKDNYVSTNAVITFDASATPGYNENKKIVSYQWDFGDGTSFVIDKPIVEHTFTNEGNFEVNLYVKDDKGNSSHNKSYEPMTVRNDIQGYLQQQQEEYWKKYNNK